MGCRKNIALITMALTALACSREASPITHSTLGLEKAVATSTPYTSGSTPPKITLSSEKEGSASEQTPSNGSPVRYIQLPEAVTLNEIIRYNIDLYYKYNPKFGIHIYLMKGVITRYKIIPKSNIPFDSAMERLFLEVLNSNEKLTPDFFLPVY